MKQYRVSIWTTIDVEAENERDAEDIAHDSIVNGEIRTRDYEIEAEERDQQWIHQQCTGQNWQN